METGVSNAQQGNDDWLARVRVVQAVVGAIHARTDLVYRRLLEAVASDSSVVGIGYLANEFLTALHLVAVDPIVWQSLLSSGSMEWLAREVMEREVEAAETMVQGYVDGNPLLVWQSSLAVVDWLQTVLNGKPTSSSEAPSRPTPMEPANVPSRLGRAYSDYLNASDRIVSAIKERRERVIELTRTSDHSRLDLLQSLREAVTENRVDIAKMDEIKVPNLMRRYHLQHQVYLNSELQVDEVLVKALESQNAALMRRATQLQAQSALARMRLDEERESLLRDSRRER